MIVRVVTVRAVPVAASSRGMLVLDAVPLVVVRSVPVRVVAMTGRVLVPRTVHVRAVSVAAAAAPAAVT